jgi:Mce-associated membrane protein
MSDEIIDDDPHPDPVPESAPEPGSQSELELPERPEVAPVAGEAGAAPATATEVVFVEDAEDEALTEDAGLAAATTNVPPVEEAGLAEDVGGSPGQAAGQVTAATTKAATKADGPKSAKTKSSKGKSGKGKSGKGKSGKGKSGKGKSVDDDVTAARFGAGTSAIEGAAPAGNAEEPGRPRRVVVALGIVAVALAVALLLALLQVSDRNALVSNQNALDSARTADLAAASTYSVDLAAYDYRHLDQDFGVVLAHSTPSFKRTFTQSSDTLKATLVKYHATAHANVVAAGVVSATTSRAVVLVFLDQTVTNSTQKQPTTDRSQVEITLVLSGRTWLIDQVTLL